MNATSHAHVLVGLRGIQILDGHVLLCEAHLRVALRLVQRQVAELVSAGVVRVLDELVLLGIFFLALAQTFVFLGLLGSFVGGGGFFLGLGLRFFLSLGCSFGLELFRGLGDGGLLLGGLGVSGLRVFCHGRVF